MGCVRVARPINYVYALLMMWHKQPMRTMIWLLMCVSLLSVSPARAEAELLQLRYEDFGPQVVAYELLGMQWWQWQAHGDSQPGTTPVIGVVVYRKGLRTEAKQIFPVSQELKHDWRYVACPDAQRYFDDVLSDESLEGLPMLSTLRQTQQIVRKYCAKL